MTYSLKVDSKGQMSVVRRIDGLRKAKSCEVFVLRNDWTQDEVIEMLEKLNHGSV